MRPLRLLFILAGLALFITSGVVYRAQRRTDDSYLLFYTGGPPPSPVRFRDAGGQTRPIPRERFFINYNDHLLPAPDGHGLLHLRWDADTGQHRLSAINLAQLRPQPLLDVNLTSLNVRDVLSCGGDLGCPSPDGRYALWLQRRDRRYTVYIMDAAGREIAPLARFDTGINVNLDAWSPDGRWIYLTLIAEGQPALHRLRVDGGKVEMLGEGWFAGQAPDGSRVALRHELSFIDWRIMTLLPDGRDRQPVTAYQQEPDNLIVVGVYRDWLPNGWIIFSEQRPAEEGSDLRRVYRIRPDGRQETRLLPEFARVDYVGASPDGRWVFLSVPDGLLAKLFRVDMATLATEELLSVYHPYRAFQWGAAREWLYFLDDDGQREGLFRLHVEASQPEFLMPFADFEARRFRILPTPRRDEILLSYETNYGQPIPNDYRQFKLNTATGALERLPDGIPLAVVTLPQMAGRPGEMALAGLWIIGAVLLVGLLLGQWRGGKIT
jgi:hypothetical protein